MRDGAGRMQVDWGHLAFLAFITGLIVWYILGERGCAMGSGLLMICP